MPSWIVSILGGISGYLAIMLGAGLLAGFAVHYVEAPRYENKILSLENAANAKQASDVSLSLAKLQGFIDKADVASTDYQNSLTIIASRFAELSKGLKDATAKPLPIDCKPDPSRLRALSSAVAAANAGNTAPTQ